jgi:DNA-binding SARP family transcriptional activator
MITAEMLGPSVFRHLDRVIDLRPLEKVIHMALYVAGGTLSMTQLAEDVWTVPTPGSLATLRASLSRSRAKVIAAGGTADQLSRTIRLSGRQSVVSLPGGWDVDIDRFRHHAAEASMAYEEGRFGEAHTFALAALGLWYYDPLPDAGQRPFAVRYVEQLQDIHWAATLTRFKAEICLGRHREVVAELRQLTGFHPEELSIAMLLATALYRSQLLPEAAALCREAITRRGEDGIEARRLQDLQHAILNEAAPFEGPLGW